MGGIAYDPYVVEGAKSNSYGATLRQFVFQRNLSLYQFSCIKLKFLVPQSNCLD